MRTPNGYKIIEPGVEKVYRKPSLVDLKIFKRQRRGFIKKDPIMEYNPQVEKFIKRFPDARAILSPYINRDYKIATLQRLVPRVGSGDYETINYLKDVIDSSSGKYPPISSETVIKRMPKDEATAMRLNALYGTFDSGVRLDPTIFAADTPYAFTTNPKFDEGVTAAPPKRFTSTSIETPHPYVDAHLPSTRLVPSLPSRAVPLLSLPPPAPSSRSTTMMYREALTPEGEVKYIRPELRFPNAFAGIGGTSGVRFGELLKHQKETEAARLASMESERGDEDQPKRVWPASPVVHLRDLKSSLQPGEEKKPVNPETRLARDYISGLGGKTLSDLINDSDRLIKESKEKLEEEKKKLEEEKKKLEGEEKKLEGEERHVTFGQIFPNAIDVDVESGTSEGNDTSRTATTSDSTRTATTSESEAEGLLPPKAKEIKKLSDEFPVKLRALSGNIGIKNSFLARYEDLVNSNELATLTPNAKKWLLSLIEELYVGVKSHSRKKEIIKKLKESM